MIRKLKKSSYFIFLILSYFLFIVYNSLNINRIDVNPLANQTNIKDLTPISTLQLPNSLNTNNEYIYGFTCTGLTYDPVSHTFWIGNYGKLNPNDVEISPSIINISKDFSIILNEINIISESYTNIQGLSFDTSNNTIWYTDSKNIINIDQKGKLLSTLDFGNYSKYKPNGLLYSSKSDSLYILCFNEILLNISKKGEIIKVIECGFSDQDQLCFTSDGSIAFSVGADYQGEDNFLYILDKDNHNVKMIYRLLGSYAVEGVAFVDGNLYVLNDGLYHNAKICKNYVNIYNIDDIN